MATVVEAAAAATVEVAAPGVSAAAAAKAYVRSIPDDDKIIVSVTLRAKSCNLNRPKDEPLEKALARLAKNLVAKPSKKDKRKKPRPGSAGGVDTAGDVSASASADDGAPSACLYEDEGATRPVTLSLSNEVAWRQGRLLVVAEDRFLVEYNAPTVDKISIPKLAMVGYPIMPAVSLLFADTSACRWRWAARRPGSSDWQDLGCNDASYTPTADDEGSVLRVECTPGALSAPGPSTDERMGLADSSDAGVLAQWLGEPVATETGVVQRGPERSSASLRCGHTPGPASAPSFRVLTYNILADQYAGSDYAQNVLFNYCPKTFLDPEYRRQLVLRELLGYQADVLCLQEVDDRAFNDYLRPHLEHRGYSGYYTNKQGKVKEGSATFWRRSRFTPLAHHDVLLRRCFAQPLPPLHAQFAPMLAASPELAHALQKVTTVAQATLLAPQDPASGEGCICVVNTHLFFHPYAPHIRTMHTAAILAEANAFIDRCLQDPRLAAALGPAAAAGGRPTLLFCGDLNSDLNDGIPGVVELLRSGRLSHDYWDWIQGAAFKWGMGEEDGEAMAQATAQLEAAKAAPAPAPAPAPSGEPHVPADASPPADGHDFESAAETPQHPIAVTGVDLALPLALRSADDLATPYTNYTSGYKALLDYVWYDERCLRVVSRVPVPGEAELGGFIPSQAFPSDHLAVVYDLSWRPLQ